MSLVNVLGMDPSLRNWGWAKGVYSTKTDELKFHDIGLIQPVFDNHKQVRQNSKDIERAEYLAKHVFELCSGVNTIFVEVPVGSQSARAMASYGICVSLLGALRAKGIPFIEVTPLELKMATIGSKTATKDAIIQQGYKQYPHLPWPTKTRGGMITITKKAEHMADAIGAVKAGLSTKEFQNLLTLIK